MKILNSIKTKFIEILKDESGQGTTEYILILVAIVAVATIFKDTIKTKIQGIIEKLSGDIDKAVG